MAKAKFYKESELVFAIHLKDPRFIDLTCQIFSRLTVLGFAGQDNSRQTFWYCRCDCGNITKVEGGKLRTGKSKSCGCFSIERARETNTIHGHTKNGNHSPEYRTWEGMLMRTQNQNCKDYQNYGARGIKVCDRWLVFANFLADMGERPHDKTLDRFPDNNGNYCPENCRWADCFEQGANKRNNVNLTYAGKTQTVTQWAAELGLKRHTIFARIKHGWSIEKTLNTLPNRVAEHILEVTG